MRKLTPFLLAAFAVTGLSMEAIYAQSQPLKKDSVEKRLHGGTEDETLKERGRFDAVDVDSVEINDREGNNATRNYDEVEIEGRYYYRDRDGRILDARTRRPVAVRSGAIVRPVERGTIYRQYGEATQNRQMRRENREVRENHQARETHDGQQQAHSGHHAQWNTAAVKFMSNNNSDLNGHARLQREGKQVRVWGDVSGLAEGEYCLCVHQYGNMIDGSASGLGDQFEGSHAKNDSAKGKQLIKFRMDNSGQAKFDESQSLPLNRLAGRSLAIHQVNQNGQPGQVVAFGVIGVAAGDSQAQSHTAGYRGENQVEKADQAQPNDANNQEAADQQKQQKMKGESEQQNAQENNQPAEGRDDAVNTSDNRPAEQSSSPDSEAPAQAGKKNQAKNPTGTSSEDQIQ
ncbi:superoxide dismutase family protein [Calycomorphotria hydatis]|uniref:Copper/zinc superoxide dismutase (SODC) n=1 Tax=Calycomorphotria hydatis TaxID=2528027 RepID=A0A517TEV4_9PLAN|nr:superoxide dismutase family protein [Calycomorphotria hydatis]QDT66903.1 Copper/zinc superoxide dismutase (SODC) [Calycomorphotria hydatis]